MRKNKKSCNRLSMRENSCVLKKASKARMARKKKNRWNRKNLKKK